MRFILLLSFFLLLLTPLARADEKCACSPNSFDTRWAQAGAVFAGTVDDIKILEKFTEYGNEDIPVEVTLTINEAYKGTKDGEKFVLHTSLTRKTCTGHPFALNQKYIVFGYQRKEETQELWSLYNFPSRTWDVGGLCGGTKLYTDFKTAEDLRDIAKQLEASKKKSGFFNKIFNP